MFICTKEHPFNKDIKDRPVQHPAAKCVGESSDGGADDYHCPICKTNWRDYLDQN